MRPPRRPDPLLPSPRPGSPGSSRFPARHGIIPLLLPVFLLLGWFRAGNCPAAPIRVGVYQNSPKVYIDDAGTVRGIFPELLDYIARQEGWELEYIPGSWAESLERLEGNEIDIMVDVAVSPERRQIYDFPEETVLANWGTVYANPDVPVDSLLDLQGRTVAVMEGSIHTAGPGGIRELVERFGVKCTFVGVDSYQKVFELLDRKEADAGVVNRLFGTVSEKDYRIRKTAIIFNPRRLTFAFPKDSARGRQLAARIDHHLRELKETSGSFYYRVMDVYLFGIAAGQLAAEVDPGKVRKIPLTAREREWIETHPVIRLGVDPEFVPFEYIDEEGNYRGISSDYVKILNQRLGLKMELVPGLSWPEAVAGARAKEIDVLPCVGRTGERLRFLRYSIPYIDFQRVIITRSDAPFIGGLESLGREAVVAVQANSSHQGYLEENTDLTLRDYPTLQEALEDVSGGRVDVFVGNLASATYWIRKLNLTNLKVAAPVRGDPRSLYFAVREDWPELVGIINKGLASITAREKNDIHRRWVSIDYSFGLHPRVLRRHLLRLGGGSTADRGPDPGLELPVEEGDRPPETSGDRSETGQGRRRVGRPAEVSLSGHDVPRAAHPPQLHHRLHRDRPPADPGSSE